MESALVLVKIVERLPNKLSEETNMLNHMMYLLGVTSVSWNSLRKKYLIDTKKQNTQSNLDESYVKNASKTNQD